MFNLDSSVDVKVVRVFSINESVNVALIVQFSVAVEQYGCVVDAGR